MRPQRAVSFVFLILHTHREHGVIGQIGFRDPVKYVAISAVTIEIGNLYPATRSPHDPGALPFSEILPETSPSTRR